MADPKFEQSFQKALAAAEPTPSHPHHGIVGSAEHEYLQNLFAWVSKDNTRATYVEPVIKRLLKRAAKETVDYDVSFRALLRAAREVARDWKLRNVMIVGIPKAAQDRQQKALARTFMDIYQTRLGMQRRTARGAT